eukprot:UN01260
MFDIMAVLIQTCKSITQFFNIWPFSYFLFNFMFICPRVNSFCLPFLLSKHTWMFKV